MKLTCSKCPLDKVAEVEDVCAHYCDQMSDFMNEFEQTTYTRGFVDGRRYKDEMYNITQRLDKIERHIDAYNNDGR